MSYGDDKVKVMLLVYGKGRDDCDYYFESNVKIALHSDWV